MTYNLNINIGPGNSRKHPFNVNMNEGEPEKPVKLYLNPYDKPIEIRQKQPTIDSYKKKPSIVSRAGKKAVRGLKSIKPGHIMFALMIGMTAYARFGLASGNEVKTRQMDMPQQQPVASQVYRQAYEQGAQHVRDSIAYAELLKQNKVLQDSIQQLKKLPK